MGHMRQTLGRIVIAALTLTLVASTYALAQDAAGGAAAPGDQAAINDAAKKAYLAIQDSKIDELWTLVQCKYDRKLRAEELRPGDTGPKVSVAFDGNVKILRTGKNYAVVGATFFKPDSSDIPAGEVSRLDLYMVNDHGAGKSARRTRRKPPSTATRADGITRALSPSAPTRRELCFCPTISAAAPIAPRPRFAGSQRCST